MALLSRRRWRRARPPARQILVVDDDEGGRAHLVSLLEGLGYRVLGAESGLRALKLLEAGARPEALLLDVRMPELDGLETLRRLRQAGHAAPVLMLSGVDDARTIVEAMRLGASSFLAKPVDEAELAAVLELLLPPRPQEASPGPPTATEAGDEEPVWNSDAMRAIGEAIERIADTDVSVLIQGETGVGKEVVARAIHGKSPRARFPFVKVHCAALPRQLLESELFGYEKGAFTGAWDSKPGKFELADSGTIFLDEIGEMSADLQAKLLQVLQDGEFTRLGGSKERKVDVRVICATNRPLERMLEEGTFRKDLYFRIHVVNLQVPPLRERREEVPVLLDVFLRRYSARYRKPVPPLNGRLLQALERHPFPGNVRELENLAKRIVVLQDTGSVLRELLGGNARSADEAEQALRTLLDELEESAGRVPLLEVGRRAATEAEYHVLERVLLATDWNRKKAARLLDVSYSTLLQKIRACGLQGEDRSSA